MMQQKEFVPFKQRGALWQDIDPVEQYDGGPAPIAPIAYPAQYEEVMGYFRAIFLKQEISERAFNLTEETITLNQGNYAAWHFRRKLLHELKKDLGAELHYLNQVGLLMEKNYQIWHHRRCIFEMKARQCQPSSSAEEQKIEEKMEQLNLSDSLQVLLDEEMAYLDQIFDSDAKNYHAWSHKIWCIERYSLWNEPRHLVFADHQLDMDVQNNSAWSFRYFIVMRGAKTFDKALVEKELKYTLEKRLAENWRNEAAWAYVRGMLASTEEEAKNSVGTNAPRLFIGEIEWLEPLLEKWSQWAETEQFSEDMVEPFDGNDKDEIISKANMRFNGLKQNRFLYATLADCKIASKQYDKAIEILEKVKTFDPIRKKFWEWRKQRALQLKDQ